MTEADKAEETTERAGARAADDATEPRATVEPAAKATVAEVKEPADAKERAADAREPAADAKEPAGDAKESAADAEKSAGDAKESAGDAKEPAADAEKSAGHAKEPVADAKEPAAEAESRAGTGGKAQSGARAESESNDGAGVGDTAAGSRWWTPLRLTAGLALVALIAAAVFGVLWATDDSADQLAALQSRLDTEAAAEAAATRYAMSVSEVDFRDLGKWRDALTEGTSAQLAPKLEAAVDVVGPWLTTMEYTASARPLAARVSENDGDRFVVQVFVDMTSKSKQAPDGVAATATYTVTMDRASNWTITDVGGVGAGLPGADAPAPAPAPAAGAPAPVPAPEGE